MNCPICQNKLTKSSMDSSADYVCFLQKNHYFGERIHNKNSSKIKTKIRINEFCCLIDHEKKCCRIWMNPFADEYTTISYIPEFDFSNPENFVQKIKTILVFG